MTKESWEAHLTKRGLLGLGNLTTVGTRKLAEAKDIAAAIAAPKMAEFHMPTPPGVNGLFVNVVGRGRVKSPEYRRWVRHASASLMASGAARSVRFQGCVSVVLTIERENRRSDVDGRGKAVLDLLVKMGILTDDRHVMDLTLRWGRFPGTVVSIASCEEIQPTKVKQTSPYVQKRRRKAVVDLATNIA